LRLVRIDLDADIRLAFDTQYHIDLVESCISEIRANSGDF